MIPDSIIPRHDPDTIENGQPYYTYYITFRAPFMVSLGFLLLLWWIVFRTWTENYGNAKADFCNSFAKGVLAIKHGELLDNSVISWSFIITWPE